MALPKKVIPNINLVPPKILLERREQLLEDITKDGTYLPKNLGYAEMDRGFLDFVKNDLKTVVEGKVIPTVDILITTQNWAQFTQTWSFQDLNGNTEPPFITVVRVPEVKYGTNPATLYNIPNQKEFFYAAVPTWNGNVKGLDIYKIPQPVPVDISFSVKIVCNRMRELNEFNKNVLQTFASRQAYTKVNGHFIPIVNTGISDESVNQVDKRRFYIQNYDFTLLGFLLDQDKFEVAPAVSRVLNFFETNMKPINPKRKRFPVNEGVFDLTVQAVRNSPVVRTISVDYTGTFTILSTQNVSAYDLFIRLSTSTEFDYYGTNVVNFDVSTGDQLRFEITQENTDPTSIITYGVSFLGSPQNLTFDLPTPSITPSNTTTPSNTPTKTHTPSITPTNTQTPSFSPSTTPDLTPNPTCTSTQGICYNYELSQVDAGGRGDWRYFSCSNGELIEITIENNQIAFVCSRTQPVQFGGVFFNLPILLGQCGLYCVGPTPTPTITKTQTPSISVTPSLTLTSTPTPTKLVVVQLVSSFGCGTINVPLILTNANNLTSISMTINYDDTNLSFVNIFGENPNLGFAYIINDIGGQIKFVWYSIEPKNLSGTLFNISFSANTLFGLSNISFDLTIPENNEITYGLQDNIASVSYINGTVESTCFTPTPTTSNTPTISNSPYITLSVTQTNSTTPTLTTTPTVTTSLNSTPNPTPTPTPTCSLTPSPTFTNTPTQTNTKTPLGTPLPTRTPTMTSTPTNTSSPTPTSSVTITPTTTTTPTLTPTSNQCPAPATLIDCSGFTLNVIGSFIRIEYVNCLNVVQSDLRIDILTTICSLTIPQVTYVAPDTSYSIIFTNVCGSFCNNLTPTPTKTPTTTPTETRVKYLLYGVLTPAAGSTNPNTACDLLTSETATLVAYSLKPLGQLTTGDVIYGNNSNLPIQSFANRYRALSATSDVSTPKYVLWWQNSGSSITTVTLCSQLPTLTPTPTPTVTPLFPVINALFVPCFIDSWVFYMTNMSIWIQVNQTEVLINEKGTIYIENHPIYGNSCWRFAQIQSSPPVGFTLMYYQGLYFDNINQCMDNYGIKCPVSSGTTYMNL